MSVKKVFAWLATLAIVLLTHASAQTYTYYVDEVTTTSKPLLITPGYMTILEFYDDVDQVMSGRPNLVKIAGVTGSKLYLTALANSGTTDLVVDVAQKSHMFRLSIASGNMARRYVIVQRAKPTPPVAPVATVAAPRPSAAPRATTPAPRAATPTTRTATASPAAQPAQSTQIGVSPASAPRATAPAAPVAAPASAPLSAEPSPRASSAAASAPVRDLRAENAALNPVWLDLAVRHLQAGAQSGQYTLFLVVRNSGTRSVLLDERNIRVAERAANAAFRVVLPSSAVVTLEPGQAKTVRVTFEGTLPRELTVSWLMLDFSSDAAYLVTRGLNVEETAAGSSR